MKANNGKGNNPLRDGWKTPKWLYDILNKQYNFKFDCCANEEDKLCKDFSNDFLKWDNLLRVCWMNPPFSIAWKMFEHFFKVVEKGVAIYRCDNLETGLWQKIILPNASWIFIPDRRISYEGLDGEGARFPSALIGFNIEPIKNISGTLLFAKTHEGVSND